MNNTRIAARQKRYRDWLEFTNANLQDADLRSHTLNVLAQYKDGIRRAWEGENNEELLESLERSLESLNNEARLRVGPA